MGRALPSWTLTAGSVAVTLLVVEGAFRMGGVSVGTVQINRGVIRRSGNPRLGFELKPRSRATAEVEYRINSFGMRSPEVALAKSAGIPRIAVLGDSIAFGYWVAEADAFPRQLEGMLAEDRTGRVEVLNFGVPGYNLDQEIETLSTQGIRFSPDLVVVAFCLNDLEGIFSYEYGLTMDRSTRSSSLPGKAREWLLEHSVLLSWVEYRFAELEARRSFVRARNPLNGPLYEEAVGEQKKALAIRFGQLGSVLGSHGNIPGLVAIFPTFGKRFAVYPHRSLHLIVAEAARGAGLEVVDLLDCFQAYDFRDVRVDVLHPNPLGHRVAAHAIERALCARGWVCHAGRQRPPCTDYKRSDFPSVRGY